MSRLDLVILMRPSAEADFRPAGPVPKWFEDVFGSGALLAERSPFLCDFLAGAARDCWQGGQEEVESGIWEESGVEGEYRFFEARALKEEGQEVLVLSLANQKHRSEQRYLQYAHEVSLHQRRLAKERERKDILLDCIVHDLSNPLSIILMNLQFVEGQLDREDLRQALARAGVQAERQRELIHFVAEAFHSELTQFEPALLAKEQGVDWWEVAVESRESHRLLAEKQGVSVRLEAVPGGTVPTVLAERTHLARVTQNVLERALRRSSRGDEVVLSLAPSQGGVRLTVREETPLTAEEAAFFAASSASAFAATPASPQGLGLYFCKMAVELWGGKIGPEAPGEEGHHGLWLELKEQPTQSLARRTFAS
ncbi:sensor histidine kinase [Roseibacillus ishigakijimensis]|uniref:histidine kinase n=1 Tax=Roseibacillus ishigakijimensis TaxID=454146 RepID=A0A934RQA4_9BACT|nr:HAMP domain-containing histidine kinase [Roseibacillus ishigakijimensis]